MWIMIQFSIRIQDSLRYFTIQPALARASLLSHLVVPQEKGPHNALHMILRCDGRGAVRFNDGLPREMPNAFPKNEGEKGGGLGDDAPQDSTCAHSICARFAKRAPERKKKINSCFDVNV